MESQTTHNTKIRILFLAANPYDTDTLRLGEEIRTIEERLRTAAFGDYFELMQYHAVRQSDLSAYLLRHRPHIVHFSGHGSLQGEIVLEDNNGQAHVVRATDLRELFRILKDDISCVVLNACWSEAQAKGIAQEIDCVIGMKRSISDKDAIRFAGGFYRGLGFGRSIQTAFDLGKNEIGLSMRIKTAVPRLRVRLGIDAKHISFVGRGEPQVYPEKAHAQTRVFIDYDKADGYDIASRLYLDLERNNIEPWMDQRGASLDESIQIAIDQCDAFILIMTPRSVQSGGFCRLELAYAIQGSKPIIPVMAKDCTIPLSLSALNWLDFRDRYSEAIVVLAAVLIKRDFSMALVPGVVNAGSEQALENYRIDKPDVTVFYQQHLSPAQLRRLPPRLAGFGGRLFGLAAIFERCIETLYSPSSETLILQGMGGVGKSSLAAGIAWGLIKYFKGGTVWINSGKATLADLCDEVGRAFEDKQMPQLSTGDKTFRARELLNGEKTLVVLDNIRSRELIRLFQTECHPQSLIVTTRERFGGLGQLVELNTLSDEPAVSLFLAISQIAEGSNSTQLQILVHQMLGGHPQAIAIAAALFLEESLTLDALFQRLSSAHR